jgi:6-phosphogluconolactonase
MTAKPHVSVDTVNKIGEKASARLLELASAAVAARGVFTVALSGGSMPSQLAAGCVKADTSAWKVLLADERVVPLDHADSNYALIREQLPYIAEENIIAIDPFLKVEECARDYRAKVEVALAASGGVFDAVYLGLGPDGHTASLFPGHALLDEVDTVVAPISDSPKPPAERVTLTLPVINAARAVVFMCTGAGKADVVKDILENPRSNLPGNRARPIGDGTLDWFLDEAAASKLERKAIA